MLTYIHFATIGINFVHYVLLFLDEALRNTHFTWGKPIPPTESTVEDDEELDDAELNLDKVEEEMAADYSEEEEEILHIDALQHVRKLPHIYFRNFIVELVVPSSFLLFHLKKDSKHNQRKMNIKNIFYQPIFLFGSIFISKNKLIR